jgi:outer membrane protein assembly factor BamD (BamD/ComL family)
MVRAPPPPAPPASAPAPAREMAVHSAADIEVNLYPEHWISDIQQMLKDGRRDDAIKNLEAFRKRYPDYKLPDDLRDLK